MTLRPPPSPLSSTLVPSLSCTTSSARFFPSGDPRPFRERQMSSECWPGSHNEGERSSMYRFHGHSLRHIWEFCISNDNNQASLCGQSYLHTTYLIPHPHKMHGPPLSASVTTLSSSSSNSGGSDWTGPPWSYKRRCHYITSRRSWPHPPCHLSLADEWCDVFPM